MVLIIGWLGDHLGLRIGMLFLYLMMGYILSIWAKPLITIKPLSFLIKKKRHKLKLSLHQIC